MKFGFTEIRPWQLPPPPEVRPENDIPVIYLPRRRFAPSLVALRPLKIFTPLLGSNFGSYSQFAPISTVDLQTQNISRTRLQLFISSAFLRSCSR